MNSHPVVFGQLLSVTSDKMQLVWIQQFSYTNVQHMQLSYLSKTFCISNLAYFCHF